MAVHNPTFCGDLEFQDKVWQNEDKGDTDNVSIYIVILNAYHAGISLN